MILFVKKWDSLEDEDKRSINLNLGQCPLSQLFYRSTSSVPLSHESSAPCYVLQAVSSSLAHYCRYGSSWFCHT